MDKDPMEEQARLHKEVADLVEELGEEDDRERRKDLKKRCLNSLSGLARPHDGRRARCLSIISEQGEHHVSLKAPWSPSHGQDIKHPAPSPKLTPTKLHSANKSDRSHQKPSNQLKIEKHESIVQDFGPLAALGGMSDEQLEEFLQEKERFERMAIEQGKGRK